MVGAALIGAALALGLGAPVVWKWELGLRRCAVAGIAFAVVSALAVTALDAAVGLPRVAVTAAVAVLTLSLAAITLLWRFYRDPERTAPTADDVVVSPADGVVIYVRRSEGGRLPVATKHGRPYALHELVRTPLSTGDAIVVGIALSFLDVHVNRAPIAGAVTAQRRHPGRFGSLKDPAAVFTNERTTTVLDRPGLQVAVVLIASRLVRRIVSYVREGEDVGLGQRIGVIRFGSQVDLVLPDRDDVQVLVRPGRRVVAGETVLARVASGASGNGAVDRSAARALVSQAGSRDPAGGAR
ncbi:MAG: phosphatidylserine decarboxylase [Solirubrobacteraceae bacterium]|jgi:phosphatidylserine decarboxylase|nr:phosphatidylserine decarboxylase [Solirubrobacteraceae bacterium]